MRQSKIKQQRRQVAAWAAKIAQARQKWMGKPILFTIPQGIGYGVVYEVSDEGDVIVSHEAFRETGLPPCKRQEDSEPFATAKLSHLLAIQTIRTAGPASVNSGENESSRPPS